ncbi:MAG: discoidin domain-containing protein [Deltaproteobacteria bacterium]|nr:discoidin domain-containing protein [Deltaproteobacteria bacterium]
MRKFIFFIAPLLTIILISAATATAQDAVRKKACMTAIGYASTPDNLKKELLLHAQRLAVGELFGELISSFTKVENFTLTEDKLTSSSAGLVRVKGNPQYYNGENFGEVCVEIEAYVTDEDREKFKPVKMTKKFCGSDKNLTTRDVMIYTKETAIVEALLQYDRRLEGIPKKHLVPLVHEVNYRESGFIPDTEIYCVLFEGIAYPIEILTMIQEKDTYLPSAALVNDLPESAFSSSSTWGNDNRGHGPSNSRFGITTNLSNWSAAANNGNQWLQVDLGGLRRIRAIATKGRHANAAQWVTSYRLSYSADGSQWLPYRRNGDIVTFPGNTDGNTEVRHDLPAEISARYIRFLPVAWYGHITMRIEAYGIR